MESRPGMSGLHGVRVLVVGAGPGLVERFTVLLSALGADVRVADSLPRAGEDARIFRPHVLLCEVSAAADGATALVHDLRREGVIVPAVAVMATADATLREASRTAGFVDALAGPVTFSDLADTIRHAVRG